MAVARLVVDRWLLERRPAPDLADWLVCVWRGDLGEAAMPLPDERLDLVWVDDGSLWLSGPETSSWSRGYPPGTTAVGVGFKPGVGPPVLHLAASEVRDARVRLEALWGDRQARELAERVAAHPDDGGRARELERAVRRLAAGARPVDEVALEVAAGRRSGTGLRCWRGCCGCGARCGSRARSRGRCAWRSWRPRPAISTNSTSPTRSGRSWAPHPPGSWLLLTSDPYKTRPARPGDDPAGVVVRTRRRSRWRR